MKRWIQCFSICQATQYLIKTVLGQALEYGLMLTGWFTRPFQPASYESQVRQQLHVIQGETAVLSVSAEVQGNITEVKSDTDKDGYI